MPVSMCQDPDCPQLVWFDGDTPIKHQLTNKCKAFVKWAESDGKIPPGAEELRPVPHRQRTHTIDGTGKPGDPGCLLALPTSLGGDHGGACYTLVERTERGFGTLIECARTTCGHGATFHVSEGSKCTDPYCGCPVWVEPGAPEDTGFAKSKRPRVEGMGPDAPVVTNDFGGSQSAIPMVFTTMPLRALVELAKLQKQGDDKYGPHNWRGISEDDHVDHALAHLFADRVGDTQDSHLVHAAWRVLAALEMRLTNEEGH